MVTAVDNMHLNMQGAVPMEERDPVHAPGQLMPVQLMDVGHHRDDDQRGLIRREAERLGRQEMLPKDEMFRIIARSGRRRPVRNRERNSNR